MSSNKYIWLILAAMDRRAGTAGGWNHDWTEIWLFFCQSWKGTGQKVVTSRYSDDFFEITWRFDLNFDHRHLWEDDGTFSWVNHSAGELGGYVRKVELNHWMTPMPLPLNTYNSL